MSNNLMQLQGKREYNDLIERVQRDDTKAFEELYDIYYPRVMSFALKFLKCKELSEEIVHDAFIKIWEIRTDLNLQLSFDGFIFKITKNLMLNALRLKVDQPLYFETIKDNDIVSNETENQLQEQEIELQLSYAIDGLPTKRKEIFVLSKVDGFSNKEIANKLKISTNTVAGQLRKAKKTLKETIKFAATI